MILDFAYSAFRVLYIGGRYGGFLLAFADVIYMVTLEMSGGGAAEHGLGSSIILLLWSGVVFAFKFFMMMLQPMASTTCKSVPACAERDSDEYLLLVPFAAVLVSGVVIELIVDLFRRL